MARPILLLLLVPLVGSLGCTPADSPAEEPKKDRFGDSRPGGGGGNDPKPRPKFGEDRDPQPAKLPVPADPKATKFDGERCMKYLKALCDIGPRVSGTDGMTKQIALLTKHFDDLGGKVTKQEFKARQKSRREDTPMTNLIVSWFPDRKSRIILCAHYDTRPLADQEGDRRNWAKPFVSANDGTSGVALMMELAHHMKTLETGVGVDFVFFDGEEYVFTGPERSEDAYFIGSEHFAAEYKKAKDKLAYKYEAAVLFDLFAHEGARLAVEGYSWANARTIVDEVWGAADKAGAKSFKYERGFNRGNDVLDDHIALQSVGIPAIDVIDFDYKHWHALSDTADKCSAKQFTEVATVITNWLKGKK
jgi:glutaminyl-peptide cyclotransferase